MRNTLVALTLVVGIGSFAACKPQAQADPPAKPVPAQATAPTATADLATTGKSLFAEKSCSACHQMDAKIVGPPLRGVVAKRGSDWVVQMIQKPDEMVKTDPIAKQLFEEYNKTPMPNIGLTTEEATAIAAYLESEG